MPSQPHHLIVGDQHQDTKDGAMSDCSIATFDVSKEYGRRLKIRIAQAVPFFSLICNLALLHLLSDIQADLRLTSTVEVGRILSHRPLHSVDGHSISTNGGPTEDGAGGDSENEWQAYLGALAAIRLCLWASVAGNALGCYGVLKPSSRFVLFSLLQAHVELLLGLASTIPVLIMILLPSLFITIEPITPIICSEILSHPQAVRDLFEPLKMLTPYDEFAGCDTWVSGCAAPVGLIGVIAWGFARWKINALLHLLYRHVRRLENDQDLESGRISIRCANRSSQCGAIWLSSSDTEEESTSSGQEKQEQDEEENISRTDHRENIQGQGRRRSLKVDLVVPSRHAMRAAKQTQQPMLFAPVPRTRTQNILRTIQVDIPH